MNFDELMKRRYELTHGKLYTLPADRLEEFRRKIIKKCPGSKKLYGQARKLIPGGAQHMLVNKDPFPITIKAARGCKVKDVDNNEYIDYLMMAGPIILGHNHPQLIKAVTGVINTEGIGTGWTSEYELKAVRIGGALPVFPVGHRGRHGRGPRGPGLHEQEEDREDRRVIPRVGGPVRL